MSMKKCFTCNKLKELNEFKAYNLTNTCGLSKNCLKCIYLSISKTKKVRKLACLDKKYHALHEALNAKHLLAIDKINNE